MLVRGRGADRKKRIKSALELAMEKKKGKKRKRPLDDDGLGPDDVDFWFSIANSEPLSTKSTNSIVSISNNFKLAIFANSFELAISQNLAERPRTWQKQTKKEETGRKPDTERWAR